MRRLPTAMRPPLAALLVAALISSGILPAPRLVHAASFTVTTTVDAAHTLPLDGNCTSTLAGSPCTLRAAVQAANFLGGGPHTINVPAGTYLLTIPGPTDETGAAGDLDITANVNLVGSGINATIVDGNGPVLNDRVLDIQPGATASISGLTLRNGSAVLGDGGGVRNRGTLSVDNTLVTSNRDTGCTSGTDAAGIFSSSSLTITNSVISNNVACGNAGGVGNFGGTLFISNSAIRDNIGSGAIVNTRATLLDVIISGNSAQSGAGLQGLGASVVRATIINNVATGAGGGILSGTGESNFQISDSVISNNTAQCGGGISGAITVSNSTISDNLATNSACGGGGLAGTANMTNVTITNNATSGIGGGIMAFGIEPSTLSNVTIAENTASLAGSGVLAQNVQVQARNTIISSAVGINCGSTGGAFVSLGNNLDNGTTCGLQSPGDLSNANPLLGPLQDNGGFTPTRALLPGSPAIDAVVSGSCPPPGTDQRGFGRPAGPRCDIGAFEFGATLATPTPSVTVTSTVTPVTPSATRTPTPTGTITPTGTLSPSPTSTILVGPSATATQAVTPATPAVPTATTTAGPTASPTPASLTLQQALALVRPSGQAGVPLSGQAGQTFTVSGAVTGSGRLGATSTTWTLTATVPGGVPPGTVPVAVVSTTQGLQGFGCAPVVAGSATVQCTGTTTGTPLAGSVVTVVFTPSLTVTGTLTAPAAGATGAGVAPLVAVVPAVPPPPPPIGPPPPPLLPPLLAEPVPAAVPAGGAPPPTATPSPSNGAAETQAVRTRVEELQSEVAALRQQLGRQEQQTRDEAQQERARHEREQAQLLAMLREQQDRLDTLLELLGRPTVGMPEPPASEPARAVIDGP